MYIGSYIIYIHIYTELYIHTHTYIQGCVNIWAYVYNIYIHMYKSIARAAATMHIAWVAATVHKHGQLRPCT